MRLQLRELYIARSVLKSVPKVRSNTIQNCSSVRALYDAYSESNIVNRIAIKRIEWSKIPANNHIYYVYKHNFNHHRMIIVIDSVLWWVVVGCNGLLTRGGGGK